MAHPRQEVAVHEVIAVRIGILKPELQVRSEFLDARQLLLADSRRLEQSASVSAGLDSIRRGHDVRNSESCSECCSDRCRRAAREDDPVTAASMPTQSVDRGLVTPGRQQGICFGCAERCNPIDMPACEQAAGQRVCRVGRAKTRHVQNRPDGHVEQVGGARPPVAKQSLGERDSGRPAQEDAVNVKDGRDRWTLIDMGEVTVLVDSGSACDQTGIRVGDTL